MKSSPLQLEWVTYPKLSFEANSSYEGDSSASMPIECSADVSYARDGHHVAELSVRNEPTSKEQQPFFFEVSVFARFSMDVDGARATYNNSQAFPRIAAVNVARILLSSARDLLSTVTARSPYGSAMIESVLLEPGDVKVGYEGDGTSFKKEIFGIEPIVAPAQTPDKPMKAIAPAKPKRSPRKTAT
jgi:Preprotein translocase subunit SecB.